ncbi:MAG: tetratricopeptide repeat protein [Rhodothermales bacterium]
MRYIFSWVAAVSGCLLCVSLLIAGCSNGDRDLTVTERQRMDLDPKVQQFLLEGEAAFRAGNYRAALAMTDSAEQYVADFADIHFLRGCIYAEMRRYGASDDEYEAALEADPEYPGAHMNMGVNLVRQGALRAAIEAFQREEAVNPNSALYLEMGRAYSRLGIPDSARMAYEESIELDSTNATAYMWLGQLHEELGEFDEALEYSRKGSELRPQNFDYKYIIGSQLFRTGRVQEAVNYLKPVAEERPWHHGAQYNLGQALMQMGEEDAARKYLAQADTAQQVQQQINEATEAINRDPDDIENWIRLGDAHRNAGMYERAVDAFRNAVAMIPQDLELQTNLATVMMESGDLEGAIALYRSILNADSERVNAWLNLGVAYGNSGQYAAARDAWENVLDLDPSNQQARVYLNQLQQVSTNQGS